MSWDSHVQALLDTGHVSHVAIFGQDGTQWAASPGFKVSGDEVRTLLYSIDDEQAALLLPRYGIKFADRQYKFLRRDEHRSLYGKSATSGCIVIKTSLAVIVAAFDGAISVTDGVCEIEKAADYLISMQM
eukprot:m.7663 g.7663  ORF g.7663 m.7663 type:complete len:130 (-) comp5269_c0_seq2:313-702(-)